MKAKEVWRLRFAAGGHDDLEFAGIYLKAAIAVSSQCPPHPMVSIAEAHGVCQATKEQKVRH